MVAVLFSFLLSCWYTKHVDAKKKLFIWDGCSQIVWGKMDNYAVGKEKRKQLLLILCQHESDRLDVWAQPISSK